MADQLTLRRRPTQARSAATFDRILEVAIVLLEEKGWEGFTTNLLAKRAGIGIQTFYHYFPNKLAVVATLAQQLIAQWKEWFEDVDRFITDRPAQGLSEAFMFFVTSVKNQPGGVAIRQAMQVSPVLREMDRKDTRQQAVNFVEAIARKHPELNKQELETAMLVSMEAGLAIIDLSFGLPQKEADNLLKNCIEMQSAFMQKKFPVMFTAT